MNPGILGKNPNIVCTGINGIRYFYTVDNPIGAIDIDVHAPSGAEGCPRELHEQGRTLHREIKYLNFNL